jgi:hypothetical protein
MIPKATADRAKVVMERPTVEGVSAPTTAPSYSGTTVPASLPRPVQVTVVVPSPVRPGGTLQPAAASSLSTPISSRGLSEVQVKFSPAMLFSASAITKR